MSKKNTPFPIDFIMAVHFSERQCENQLVNSLLPWFEEPPVKERIVKRKEQLSTLSPSEIVELFAWLCEVVEVGSLEITAPRTSKIENIFGNFFEALLALIAIDKLFVEQPDAFPEIYPRIYRAVCLEDEEAYKYMLILKTEEERIAFANIYRANRFKETLHPKEFFEKLSFTQLLGLWEISTAKLSHLAEENNNDNLSLAQKSFFEYYRNKLETEINKRLEKHPVSVYAVRTIQGCPGCYKLLLEFVKKRPGKASYEWFMNVEEKYKEVNAIIGEAILKLKNNVISKRATAACTCGNNMMDISPENRLSAAAADGVFDYIPKRVTDRLTSLARSKNAQKRNPEKAFEAMLDNNDNKLEFCKSHEIQFNEYEHASQPLIAVEYVFMRHCLDNYLSELPRRKKAHAPILEYWFNNQDASLREIAKETGRDKNTVKTALTDFAENFFKRQFPD